jgi:ubiquinone biosynthesis protein
VICYLDFGMMGRVDRQQREQIADLVGAVAMRDETHVVRAVLRITERDPDVEPDLRLLERDVATFMQLHLGDRLEDIRVDRLLHALIDLVNRHGLRMPADLVMMIKAMATVEGYGRMLDPNFDMITAAAPYVKRIKRERFHPQRIARDLYDTGVDLLELAQQIPGGFRDLLLMAKQGRLQIGFDHRGLDPFMESNERIANRVSFAIVVAALIVGSSLIIQSRLPPTWNDVPVIGLAGFVLAGVMGLWLLISIIRHGRM